MSFVRRKRLSKELTRFQERKNTNGLELLSSSSSLSSSNEKPTKRGEEEEEEWMIQMTGAEGTLYAKESYKLSIRFPLQYPMQPPEVQFDPSACPIHPHIYSNGHICLSILYQEWSPALNVESILLSILSMLSSATSKKRPPDDKWYVRFGPKSSQKTRWAFDDDQV